MTKSTLVSNVVTQVEFIIVCSLGGHSLSVVVNSVQSCCVFSRRSIIDTKSSSLRPRSNSGLHSRVKSSESPQSRNNQDRLQGLNSGRTTYRRNTESRYDEGMKEDKPKPQWRRVIQQVSSPLADSEPSHPSSECKH
jgi:hypothetical protein